MGDRHHRWAVVGLGVLGSIGAGVLMGEQASADMTPFYANLATNMPRDRPADGVEMVSADGSKSWVETPAIDYPQVASADTSRTGY